MNRIRVIIFILLTALLLCMCYAVSADDGTIRDGLTAVELTRLMGNGTNLGNTMEACDTSRMNWSGNPKTFETVWGMPVTTQAMIDGMKASGFDTIRIPVAWMTNATSMYMNGDYSISPAYLSRVKEIADYARNAGMYVIINDHWDGGWWGMFGSDSAETRELAMKAYTGMWEQIAGYFRDYSDYVIFESANEELGGSFDMNSKYCNDSVSNYMTEDERYALTNRINQAFVDTVRATGGNNTQRFLLIAGFSTNILQTCDARFAMPFDTAENKLLVSVHFYDPWSYCGASSASGATRWGTKTNLKDMFATLGRMQQFVSKGYGVVIGEYGVLPGNGGILKENTLVWHRAFLDCCDRLDMTSCLWDCCGFYNRRTCCFYNDEMAKLYAGRNAASETGTDRNVIRKRAGDDLDAMIDTAPDKFTADAIEITDENSVAWIMWNDGGWALSYSVGDTYNPDSISGGIITTDTEITGEGIYTIGLDFSGTDQGYSANTAFSAIGIANGELLWPGYCVQITEVKINGETVKMKGRPYTTSDDGKCTRVNLYNEWVTSLPEGARVMIGDLTGCSPTPLDRNNKLMNRIESIYVTFRYGPRQH